MHVVLGPLLLAAGLILLHLSVHGAFRNRRLRFDLGRLLPRRNRSAVPPPRRRPRITEGDLIVTDMLSEMLRLREEITSLQGEILSLRTSQQVVEVARPSITSRPRSRSRS
jgi:hypothetical protein